jgi:hypothetical protein
MTILDAINTALGWVVGDVRVVPKAPPTFDLGANLDVLLAVNATRALALGPLAGLGFALALVGAVAAAERHGFDRRDMLGMFARFERPTLAAIDGLRIAAIAGGHRG